MAVRFVEHPCLVDGQHLRAHADAELAKERVVQSVGRFDQFGNLTEANRRMHNDLLKIQEQFKRDYNRCNP